MSCYIKAEHQHLLEMTNSALVEQIFIGQQMQQILSKHEDEVRLQQLEQSKPQIALTNELQAIRREMTRRGQHDATAKRILAERFGELHDWHLAFKPFSLDDLANRSTQSNFKGSPGDHPYYYRKKAKPYRASAIALHEYNWEQTELAAHNGLRTQTVTDFPSWWYPGRTTLVLITPDSSPVNTNQ